MENQKVYMIQLDYTTPDYDDVNTYLFKNKEDAKKEFFRLIDVEKKTSWVKDAYTNNVLDAEQYDLDTNIDDDTAEEYFWTIGANYDWYYRTSIELRIMEVQ